MTSFSSIDVEVRRHQAGGSPWTYRLLDQRQREIAERVRSGGPGALLISEVAPVITYGRRTAPTDLLMSADALARLGIETLATDRGGLATYHGPGQWVVFAVDSLERLTGDRRGVRKAVQGLLDIALDVGRGLDPTAEIRDGCELGVWTQRGKFAAVGIHIEQGVLLHGLALNAYRTPTSFVGLRPCGLDASVDFLLEPRDAWAGPVPPPAPGVADLAERDKRFMEMARGLEAAAFRKFWFMAAAGAGAAAKRG